MSVSVDAIISVIVSCYDTFVWGLSSPDYTYVCDCCPQGWHKCDLNRGAAQYSQPLPRNCLYVVYGLHLPPELVNLTPQGVAYLCREENSLVSFKNFNRLRRARHVCAFKNVFDASFDEILGVFLADFVLRCARKGDICCSDAPGACAFEKLDGGGFVVRNSASFVVLKIGF